MIDNYKFCILKEEDMLSICGGGSEELAKNLKRLRIQIGYKREELADELNASLSTIAKYESGLRVPDIDTIIKLADILNTDINSLIF
ncbi:helix-turn-helix domain-containing protein [Leuconostoc mesenteroides]|uniref:helix-turn-helix domain-containing protein n=1 Tax=Leuconostoc mesenteroides TaxID=1245 RepID=UPI0021C0A0D2|nr:helix-turn-helix transcriptional regulator [Leuconostoc mesenteroides]MCT8384937.1 XRE family transcriptional regulator [Leuconostoc mesenteroides]